MPIMSQFPVQWEDQRLYRQQLEELYADWRKGWEKVQPQWEPQNVRHQHNPDWRNSFFSIQAAHDGKNPFWRAAKVFSNVASFSFALVSMPAVVAVPFTAYMIWYYWDMTRPPPLKATGKTNYT